MLFLFTTSRSELPLHMHSADIKLGMQQAHHEPYSRATYCRQQTGSFQPSFFTIISPREHSKSSKFKEIYFPNDSAGAMAFHCPTLQYTSGTQCSVFRCLTAITRCLTSSLSHRRLPKCGLVWHSIIIHSSISG